MTNKGNTYRTIIGVFKEEAKQMELKFYVF